jgi:zinc protease
MQELGLIYNINFSITDRNPIQPGNKLRGFLIFVDSVVPVKTGMHAQKRILQFIEIMRTSVAILLIHILFLPIASTGQSFKGSDPLPQDPDVLTGTLKNGLSYYIRKNSKPENRIEFRLVVNAGSILEEEDQLGLAHFLEHMAFNGTRNFSKNDLINFLEHSGVSFGADLNAYTSFDETVYMFQMPSDRSGLIDSAFMVLEDWAQYLTLDPEEIDKERGVIKEEWRLGLGANDRMQKKTLPILFKDSRYAERLPIGKMEVIDSFPYEALERFYEDWYRPDLMAVICVGDIDPEYAEKKIRKHFGRLKMPDDEKNRIYYDIPENTEPLIAIASDKEATSNQVALFYKQDKMPFETWADYRRQILLNLYSMMLNARFYELSQQPDAPFLYASSYFGEFIARSRDAWQTFASAKENQVQETLELLLIENERARKYGFTQKEMERQKAEVLSFLESSLQEKNKTESSRYVREYISHFLTGEPFPGIENEYQFVKAELPGITLEEVNALSNELITKDNLVAMITGPEKEGNAIPTEKEVFQQIMLTRIAQVTPYEENVIEGSLVQEELPGGTILNMQVDEIHGYSTMELSNGIQVTLKSTDFQNDEILMTGFNLGGTSRAPDSLYFTASLASAIINQSGLGPFGRVDLTKYLAGKNVSVNPQISDLTMNIAGSSTKKDFETMLQLTYLYFTQPRYDSTAFTAFKSRVLNQVEFIKAEPQAALIDTLYKMATGNDIRSIVIPTKDQLESLQLDPAYDFYTDMFSDAEGFHFFFVGSFHVDSIAPMIAHYLGSLPSTNRPDHWVDVTPEFPEGISKANVYKGSEPKSTVVLMMEDAFEWNRNNRLGLNMLMKILDIRLRESMREDQGGVYGVSVQHSTTKYPEPNYSITINWGCAPENVDTLVATVFNEMKKLAADGPAPGNLQKARETLLRDLETNERENQYWLNVLRNSQFYNEPVQTMESLRELIHSITIEDIKNVAESYFKDQNYVQAVLYPEDPSDIP